MRILVISDSHGKYISVEKVLLREPQAEIVIHLGDGAFDLLDCKDDFPEKMFVAVRGNCDFGTELPLSELRSFSGVRIFFTHGHMYEVKFGLPKLINTAMYNEADIVLFGHTHNAVVDYIDGLHIMNPGSLGAGYSQCSYGIIDITDAGIVCSIKEFDEFS